MKELVATLRACGHQPIMLADSLLILPLGGRILGLAPDGVTNALWVNPALGSAPDAKALLSDPGWMNLGGDRTWVSPEIDTHVSDPDRMLETYAVPRTVDMTGA